MSDRILTINGGSSTIKFAAFTSSSSPQGVLTGQVKRIGRADTTLAATDTSRAETNRMAIHVGDLGQAAHSLIDWIEAWAGAGQFQAIGHRIVHGGVRLDRRRVVTPDLVQELRRTQSLDLAHLPREIALIEAFQERLPGVCRSRASTRPSTGPFRESRRSLRFPGATLKPAYGAVAFMAFRMLTCWRNCVESRARLITDERFWHASARAPA